MPRRLARAAPRGLERDPARRFPSMDELLAAITPPPRRAWLLAGVVAGLAAGLILFALTRRDPAVAPPPPGGCTDDLAALWTAEARTAYRAKFPQAAWIDEQVGWLDGYAGEWSRLEDVACRAGDSKQDACLDDALAAFRVALAGNVSTGAPPDPGRRCSAVAPARLLVPRLDGTVVEVALATGAVLATHRVGGLNRRTRSAIAIEPRTQPRYAAEMRRILLVMTVAVLVSGCDKLFGKGDDETGDDDVFIDASQPPPPDAEPALYQIGGRVANLLGTGLVLELDGGEQLTFGADASFDFVETRLAGSTYTVTIATQPTSTPPQTCSVRNGDGTIAAADITDIEIECTVGTLRITEVSNCFFANVPCWVEILNTSATDSEDLSAYRLRTDASPRGGGTVVQRSFVLPSLTIPAGGYAVVRGRGSDDLVDGLNLVNLVENGDLVPYWNANGFVELTKSGKTVDFARFGNSAITPTTIGWYGANAPPVPASMVYGSAVARDLSATDTSTGTDWVVRAFGTPGGVNDLTSDADVDADGIPDQAEVSGGRFAGLDLFAMGARTAQRDLFIEIDRMTSADPGVTPREVALDKLVAAFAAHGIVVHPDVGPLITDYNLGGGNVVPFSALISLGAFGGAANHYALKAAHMDIRRQAYAHYMVFAEELTNVPAGTAGLAELDGNDLVIALGFLNLPADTAANINRLDNYQATTMMHELGHNLGLRHGGNEDANYKANYVSVMNYLYSFAGLPTIGTDEGDRYRLFRSGAGCATAGEIGLTNSPYTTTFVLDFSVGTSLQLNEAALDESLGLRRNGSTSVDFNCSGAINGGTVIADVVPGISLLNDYDDWANLELAFAHDASGASFVFSFEQDQFTDEVRPLADETGFTPPR